MTHKKLNFPWILIKIHDSQNGVKTCFKLNPNLKGPNSHSFISSTNKFLFKVHLHQLASDTKIKLFCHTNFRLHFLTLDVKFFNCNRGQKQMEAFLVYLCKSKLGPTHSLYLPALYSRRLLN